MSVSQIGYGVRSGGRRVWEEKHRREWQIGRQGADLVVNVMCYIRFHSLAALSSGKKERITFGWIVSPCFGLKW